MALGKLSIAAVGTVVLLAGCATVRELEAPSTESLLAASGFEQRVADTPSKQAELAAMPQDTLIRHDVDGQLRFVFADASGCQCMYAGNQAAYDEYQKLSTEQNIAAMNAESSMMWDAWGPWDGYWDGPFE